MKLSGHNWKHIGGATIHVVADDRGATVGWVHEVFSDVFYTHFADPNADLDKKSIRHRSMENALAEFNA